MRSNVEGARPWPLVHRGRELLCCTPCLLICALMLPAPQILVYTAASPGTSFLI